MGTPTAGADKAADAESCFAFRGF